MKTILNYLAGYFRHVDKLLPIICVGLTVFDVMLINSMTYENIDFINPNMAKTQLIAGILGVCASFAISIFDYRYLEKLWFIYAPAAIILQLMIFIPGLGVQVDDDMAWLDFGFITVQPSEILKVAFILTFSVHINKIGDKINQPKHVLLLCLHGLAPVALIMKQGDAGSALVFLFIFICMMFMAGISWKYMLIAVAAVPPVLYVAWNYIMKSHHRNRILILFDKEMQQKEILGLYWQQYRGTIALGSGQLKGLGFDSTNYTETPKIENDFIFAYIGMTLGFIGCMCIVIALAALCMKLLSDASAAQEPFGKMICVGVFAQIFFHCVINIGMALCVVPVIGIPLPFISQGGTAMLMMHADIGLVMSVTAHREKPKHMFYTEKD